MPIKICTPVYAHRIMPKLSSDTSALLLFAGLMNIVLVGLAAWELIPTLNGLPYDSAIFADIARRFDAYGFHIRLDSYFMQRLFPCALVGGFASLFHIEITRPYLVNAFRVLDCVSINLTLILVADLLRLNGIRGRPRLFALILCFCNFCILKFALYFPALTDCCTIAIVAAMLHAYYKQRSWQIFILGIFGAFTHPLLIFVAAALYSYPFSRNTKHESKNPAPGYRWIPYSVSLAYLAACSWIYLFAHDYILEWNVSGPAPVNLQLYFLSALIGAAYLFIVLRLAVVLGIPSRLLRELRGRRVIPVLLLIVLVKAFQHWRATGPGPLNARLYVRNILMYSLTEPGQFLVAHISFLGPVVLLVAILFHAFRRELSKQGTGFIAVLLMMLPLLLNSESRQCSFVLPLLVLPLAAVFQTTQPSRKQLIVIATAALLIAKIWLPINVGPPALLKDPGYLNPRLFLNDGPWMLWQAYLVQAIAYAIIGIVLYLVFRKPRVG